MAVAHLHTCESWSPGAPGQVRVTRRCRAQHPPGMETPGGKHPALGWAGPGQAGCPGSPRQGALGMSRSRAALQEPPGLQEAKRGPRAAPKHPLPATSGALRTKGTGRDQPGASRAGAAGTCLASRDLMRSVAPRPEGTARPGERSSGQPPRTRTPTGGGACLRYQASPRPTRVGVQHSPLRSRRGPREQP